MNNIVFSRDHAHISEDRMNEAMESVAEYSEQLRAVVKQGGYEELEASLNVVDGDFADMSIALANKLDPKRFKYVVVAGIGGSNLGTKAIYDALNGQLHYLKENSPRLIFLDTVSPRLIQDLKDVLSEVATDEVLVNVISKSGGTMETLAHLEELKDFQMVYTTDEGSKLWERGLKEEVPMLPLPKMVGGRFSVFTAVGLFPLAMAGVDVKKLVESAKEMRDFCLYNENIALESAACTFLHREEGLIINNNFFFNPELESVGKWYRQLMGESIGKKYDLEHQEVFRGITPIVSIGSTDLHSMAQLYFGGPKDKFTNFVYASQIDLHPAYANTMDAIYAGTKKAYENNRLPFMEVSLESVDEETVAAYLQFKMVEIMYLAKLLNVNAFNQPQVEEYKKETRNVLNG